MSRIDNFLMSKRNCTINKSLNSESIYYNFYNRIIRVSNHYNYDCSDISIILPKNSKTLYMVQFKSDEETLILNWTELKSLIESSLLMWKSNYKIKDISTENFRKKYERSLKMIEDSNKKLDQVTNKFNSYVKKADKELRHATKYVVVNKSNFNKVMEPLSENQRNRVREAFNEANDIVDKVMRGFVDTMNKND